MLKLPKTHQTGGTILAIGREKLVGHSGFYSIENGVIVIDPTASNFQTIDTLLHEAFESSMDNLGHVYINWKDTKLFAMDHDAFVNVNSEVARTIYNLLKVNKVILGGE